MSVTQKDGVPRIVTKIPGITSYNLSMCSFYMRGKRSRSSTKEIITKFNPNHTDVIINMDFDPRGLC